LFFACIIKNFNIFLQANIAFKLIRCFDITTLFFDIVSKAEINIDIWSDESNGFYNGSLLSFSFR